MNPTIRSMIRSVASRLAAVIVAAAVLWLSARFGLEVSEDQYGQAVSFFTDALTGLGWLIGMIVYPLVHKILNRRVNPVDSATPSVPPSAAPIGYGWDR